MKPMHDFYQVDIPPPKGRDPYDLEQLKVLLLFLLIYILIILSIPLIFHPRTRYIGTRGRLRTVQLRRETNFIGGKNIASSFTSDTLASQVKAGFSDN